MAPDMVARCVYTTEMFDPVEHLANASSKLLTLLDTAAAGAVTLIPPAAHAQGSA